MMNGKKSDGKEKERSSKVIMWKQRRMNDENDVGWKKRSGRLLVALLLLGLFWSETCSAFVTSGDHHHHHRAVVFGGGRKLGMYAPPGSGYTEPEERSSSYYPETYEPMMEYPGTMRPGRTLENQPFQNLPILAEDPDPVPWPHFQEIEWHHPWGSPHEHPIPMEEFIELQGRWASAEEEAAMRAGVRRNVRERRELEELEAVRSGIILDDDDDDDDDDDTNDTEQQPTRVMNVLVGSEQPRNINNNNNNNSNNEEDEDDDFLLDLGLDTDEEEEEDTTTAFASSSTSQKSSSSPAQGLLDAMQSMMDASDDDDDLEEDDLDDLNLDLGLLDDEDEEDGLTMIGDDNDSDDDDDDPMVPLDDMIDDEDADDNDNSFDDGGFDYDDFDFDDDGGDMY
jgi:hypothetical protein